MRALELQATPRIAQISWAGIHPFTGNNELKKALSWMVFFSKTLELLATGGCGCEELSQIHRELY